KSLSGRLEPIPEDFYKRKAIYTYTDEDGSAHTFSVEVAKSSIRKELSTKIILENDSFSEGFKVVQTANGEFGYIKEEDGRLLPYRFDIAGDFDEHGLAMVGKNGEVSWINKKFEFLSADGIFRPCQLYIRPHSILRPNSFHKDINALSKVFAFERENPVPIVSKDDETTSVRYLGLDGKIVKFYGFDGEAIRDFVSNFPEDLFKSPNYEDISFDIDGHLIMTDRVLFRSTYVKLEDLIKIGKKKGLLDEIESDVKKLQIEPVEDKK
ncbi:MAG TPA: hypothetical protein DCY94_00515, partial [Firmicutes bacterium]|nr:hypothetical protein [Bacillota bacterium]